MQWYYAVNNQRQGPITEAEFDKSVSEGHIKSDTLVWRIGMTEWRPYSEVAAATAPTTAAGTEETEICAVSGKRYPKREMIQYEGKWISGEHRDEFFQRMREGVGQPGQAGVGQHGYGGFWLRFVARFIDGMAQGVVVMPVAMGAGFFIASSSAMRSGSPVAVILLQVVIQCFSMAVALAYEVFFVRKYDGTPGKLALSLKLLRSDGSKLSIGRIIGRYFATMLSGIPTLMIGFIMAGFDDEKRALHDRICDTRVVKGK